MLSVHVECSCTYFVRGIIWIYRCSSGRPPRLQAVRCSAVSSYLHPLALSDRVERKHHEPAETTRNLLLVGENRESRTRTAGRLLVDHGSVCTGRLD